MKTMQTQELINALEKNDYLLPKDILSKVSEDKLIEEIQEIFDKYSEKINNEEKFRKNYLELITFVFLLNLAKEKTKRKKVLFNKNLMNYVLSIPETA